MSGSTSIRYDPPLAAVDRPRYDVARRPRPPDSEHLAPTLPAATEDKPSPTQREASVQPNSSRNAWDSVEDEMSNKKRARTRAVRAEMDKSGDNYTRAAAKASNAGSTPSSRTGTDAVREHVRRVIEASRGDDQARLRRADELERDGYKIVDGGQIGPDTWAIYDWRTNQLLAEGDNGIEGYDAAAEELDPNEKWFHYDHLYDEVPLSDVETPGVPPSLGRAIEDWLGMESTPDTEIAAFVGWSVDEVRAHREENRD